MDYRYILLLLISVQVSVERTETLQQNNPRYAVNIVRTYIAHSWILIGYIICQSAHYTRVGEILRGWRGL